MIEPKKEFMEAAIKEAVSARGFGDYAVGAVIVLDNKIIAKSGNRTKIDQDPTHRAEILAISEAARVLKSRHLHNCILYTTHEPCSMCSAASVWAKMSGVVYGAKQDDMKDYRTKNGNHEWLWRTIDIPASDVLGFGDPKIILIGEFMREECKKLFHS